MVLFSNWVMLDAINYLFFLVGFGLIAFEDHYKKEVPDIYTALLWAFSALSGYDYAFPGLILCFGGLYLINSGCEKVFGWHLLEWADILMIPVFVFAFSALRNKPIVPLFALLGIFVPISISLIKRSKVSVGEYLFVAYLLGGIAYALI